jgi:uncharacterized protein (DUF58 family)
VLFGLVLVLAGLFLSEPIIFVSVPMMGVIGFAILQFRRPNLPSVRLTRTLEKVQVNEEETSRVQLAVSNAGTIDIALLQITDWIPVELVGENTRTAFTINLRAGESRSLLYEVRGNHFGEYSIGPVTLSLQDAAGLLESSATLDLRSKMIVFPKTAGRLTGFTIGPKTTRPRPGEIPARRIGAGTDYFTTRQLLPGEYARRINWKASARMADEDKLLSNEFTTRQVAETLIVLDCGSDLIKDKRGSITTYSVRAAMSVAQRLLRDKNRVGVLAIGATSQKVAPAYGRRQYDRIALTLAKFSPGSSFFGERVSSTVRYFYPRVSQILLISPLIDKENTEIAFDLARSSSTFDLMILSPNPLDFPLGRNWRRRLERSREGRIALRLAEMERKATIGQLEATRMIVLDWHVFEPLEQVVAANRQNVARRVAQLAGR